MRIIAFGIAVAGLAFAGTVSAQSGTTVRGYTRADGTYVQPHHRTNPNTTRNDNWTTRPNVNPYTGRIGTRAPDYSPRPYTPRRSRY